MRVSESSSAGAGECESNSLRQLAGRGTSEHEIVNVAISGSVVTAQTLCGVHANFGVRLHELEEVLAIDKVQLARAWPFRRWIRNPRLKSQRSGRELPRPRRS